MSDIVIATTLCFKPYGHVKDEAYRSELWFQMRASEIAARQHPDFKIHRIARIDDGCGWNQNYLNILNEAKDVAPFCLIADSDGYFDYRWQWWLEEAMWRYPKAAGWTLYNSPRLSDYNGDDLDGDNFGRRHVGPHGLVFRTADYVASAEGEWFENFIGKIAEKRKAPFVVPKISKLQHCGAYGLNNIPGGSEDFDPNFPYNQECLTLHHA